MQQRVNPSSAAPRDWLWMVQPNRLPQRPPSAVQLIADKPRQHQPHFYTPQEPSKMRIQWPLTFRVNNLFVTID